MDQFHNLFFGFFAILALVSLVTYVALSLHGTSDVLFSVSESRCWSWRTITFVVLVGIALIAILYSGVHALLWWMPSSWGWVDDEDHYTTLRQFIAGALAIIGAPAIAVIFSRHSTMLFEGRLDSLRSEVLQAIADSLHKPHEIERLRLGYSKRHADLKSALETSKRYVGSGCGVAYPRERELDVLRGAIWVLEGVEAKLADVAKVAVAKELSRRGLVDEVAAKENEAKARQEALFRAASPDRYS